MTLAVTATWINSCLFLERTEYLCEIEQYYSINKRDGNLQRIDQKSWTIDLWTGHELDMSETCNGFYNRFISKWYWIIFNRNKFRESKKSREKLFCLLVDQPVCVSGKPEYELMQTAWRERNPDARIKAAKDAIVLNPECATAYILLAEVKSFVIYEVVFSHTAEKWKNQDI